MPVDFLFKMLTQSIKTHFIENKYSFFIPE